MSAVHLIHSGHDSVKWHVHHHDLWTNVSIQSHLHHYLKAEELEVVLHHQDDSDRSRWHVEHHGHHHGHEVVSLRERHTNRYLRGHGDGHVNLHDGHHGDATLWVRHKHGFLHLGDKWSFQNREHGTW